MSVRTLLGLGVTVALLVSGSAGAADPGLQLFEQKIRPVLVKHCYSCHSAEAKKQRGGLLLDSRAALLKGGDSGPALVPGKPMESLIVKALHHDGPLMPPNEKLADAVVADFERWISLGAPDPRTGLAAVRTTIDLEAGRKFWAFRPPRHHPIPAVTDASWPRSDVDRFLLAAMEARGVKPVRDADPVTLLRRLTIDLIGLPPTPEETDEFVAEYAARPETALRRAADRLLASPHFGERWGRHWLDVARYADSNGKDENLTFHEAWRYRDYVIKSFNADKPFNVFAAEQLAGDLLPGEGGPAADERLTGTGFLVVGPKVLADRDFPKRKMDVVDEQIDTVGKTFLGLTLGCARCHDHKFDPLPTADYYALAGIFASTRTLDGIKLGNAVVSGWMERPLGPDGVAKLAAVKDHQKKVAAVADQVKKLKADLKGFEDKATMRLPGKLLGFTVDDKQAKFVGSWKASTYSRPYVGEGYVHDDKSGKGEKSATFTPDLPKAGEYEVYVSYTSSMGRSTNTPVAVKHAGGETTVRLNQEQKPKLDELFQLVGKFKFEKGGQGQVTIGNKDTTGYVIVDAVRWVPVGDLEKDPEMAMGVPSEVKQKIAESQAKLKELEAEEARLKSQAPPAPALVMAVREDDQVADARVNIRGSVQNLGDVVPRGFVTVASGEPAVVRERAQSGRLELARWLTDEKNPLTARVFVNRVWLKLFGEGLVRTPDNFGVQGDRPSHPELLDELALKFMEDGWSVKKLIRTLVLSRAYGLASEGDAAATKVDPENRLLWRAFRRRLEAEVIRDTILSVSGKLDRGMGGSAVAGLGERAIDNDSKGGVNNEQSVRRSVYLAVVRNDLPQLFDVFDFADPEVTTGRRDATTVATQALYLMNSAFANEQARATAKRLLTLPDDRSRVTDLYRRALGRSPTGPEVDRGVKFVAEWRKSAKTDADVEAWSALCLAVFGCTEFRFVE